MCDYSGILIPVSDVMEYLYCPRFMYYERVLKIPEFQELRLKVRIGREIHEQKIKTLGSYLRKRLGVTDKKVNLKVISSDLHLIGIIDELLFFDDGTIGPLDYKFAEWKGHVHKPLYYQSMIYAVLAEELLGLPSNRGYIVYTRSSNHVQRVDFPEDRREKIRKTVNNVLDILTKGVYPEVRSKALQCADCTYRKICLR